MSDRNVETNGAGRAIYDEPPRVDLDDRVFGLLKSSFEENTRATRESTRAITERLDRVGGKLDRVESAVAALQITPKLVGLLAICIGVFGGALGLKLGLDSAGVSVTAEPVEATP